MLHLNYLVYYMCTLITSNIAFKPHIIYSTKIHLYLVLLITKKVSHNLNSGYEDSIDCHIYFYLSGGLRK